MKIELNLAVPIGLSVAIIALTVGLLFGAHKISTQHQLEQQAIKNGHAVEVRP